MFAHVDPRAIEILAAAYELRPDEVAQDVAVILASSWPGSRSDWCAASGMPGDPDMCVHYSRRSAARLQACRQIVSKRQLNVYGSSGF